MFINKGTARGRNCVSVLAEEYLLIVSDFNALKKHAANHREVRTPNQYACSGMVAKNKEEKKWLTKNKVKVMWWPGH